MVTGSFASSLFGEPRATHDIDLVSALTEDRIDELVSQFAHPAYYLSRDAVLEAVVNGTMFNLLSIDEGDNVDFWMMTNEPFDQARFSRKIRKTIGGISVWISTPEDTILAKLRWCKLAGGSEKQLTDALRVFEVQHGAIDENYLDVWATKLDVTDLWNQIRDSAATLDESDSNEN